MPCIVSDALAPGQLALFDCSGFAANEGAIAVSVADGAALQMRTDPAQEAAELVPLFQTNMTALRVVSAFGLRRSRANAAALLEDVPTLWGAEFEGGN